MSFLTELKKKRKILNHTCTKVTTEEGKVLLEEFFDGQRSVKVFSGENTGCPGFVVDVNPDLQVAEIIPSSLYLGSQDVTYDMQLLKDYNILHILSLGVDVPYLSRLPALSYHFIPVFDLPSENLTPLLKVALPLIADVINKGESVFVHCNAGVSRGPTVVTAFLMAQRGITFKEAFSLIKEKRPSSKPNAGFIEQLLELEMKLMKGITEFS